MFRPDRSAPSRRAARCRGRWTSRFRDSAPGHPGWPGQVHGRLGHDQFAELTQPFAPTSRACAENPPRLTSCRTVEVSIAPKSRSRPRYSAAPRGDGRYSQVAITMHRRPRVRWSRLRCAGTKDRSRKEGQASASSTTTPVDLGLVTQTVLDTDLKTSFCQIQCTANSPSDRFRPLGHAPQPRVTATEPDAARSIIRPQNQSGPALARR